MQNLESSWREASECVPRSTPLTELEGERRVRYRVGDVSDRRDKKEEVCQIRLHVEVSRNLLQKKLC
jgi:hypothetical protein